MARRSSSPGLTIAPWLTITGTDPDFAEPLGALQNRGEAVQVPTPLLWLAVVALIACVAIGVLVQVRPVPRGLRVAGVVLDALGIIGGIASAFVLINGDSGRHVGWGVWLTAVGLALLGYATLFPARLSAATTDGPGPRAPAPPARAARPAAG